MTPTNELSLTCFLALQENLIDVSPGWDMASADLLRTAMLRKPQPMIQPSVTAMEVYQALLPWFDLTIFDSTTYTTLKVPSSEEIHNLMDNGESSFLGPVSFGEEFISMGRKFVKMEAEFDLDGKITPTVLHWPDGKTYPIDKVLDVRPAPSLKAGGQGLRYICRICGQERPIWLEDGRWFVEEKDPA